MVDSALKGAVVSLLSPLVRYLIRQGWTCPALYETIKAIYVAEVVHSHDDDMGRTSTDSRISLLTGIHRKDVKRLRTELTQGRTSALRHGANLAARVVGSWVSTPAYVNPDGTPKVLPLRDKSGGASFENLVRDTKADMRPKAILDELLHAGVAETDPQGNVRLLRTAYVSALPRDKLAFLGDNVGDHLQSALHNISTPQEPLLERAVYYDAIPVEALESLRPAMFRLGDQLLRQIYEQLLPLEKEDGDTTQQTRRVRLGVYYYEETSPQPNPLGIRNEEDSATP
ncbi:MAG TPA: DUF6502 family protein [Gammaproteobacteria bacterium]|nr:DUF6502 family protein [Gammaproteobacteria bacterium]